MTPSASLVVQHLCRHLRGHPDACDTSEGIARWWIHLDGPVPVPIVEAALGWLCEQRLVESIPAADGRVRYRRVAGSAVGSILDALAADAPSEHLFERPGPSSPRLH